MTLTDDGSIAIVIEKAANGDLRSFYNRLIEETRPQYEGQDNFYWDYKYDFNAEKNPAYAESPLSWEVFSPADRMLFAF